MTEDNKRLFCKAGTLVYAVTSAGWLISWIPFGIGYYGFPWRSPEFRIVIVGCAAFHLLAGFGLVLLNVNSRTLRWIAILSVVMSGLGSIAMIDWLFRYVFRLKAS